MRCLLINLIFLIGGPVAQRRSCWNYVACVGECEVFPVPNYNWKLLCEVGPMLCISWVITRWQSQATVVIWHLSIPGEVRRHIVVGNLGYRRRVLAIRETVHCEDASVREMWHNVGTRNCSPDLARLMWKESFNNELRIIYSGRMGVRS